MLKRAQAPFVLPDRCLLNDQPSASALRAVRKRLLYSPAKWPEELDDRSSVRGALTLTFDTSDYAVSGWPALLLIRARMSGPPVTDAALGPLTILGHNPQQHGFQAYLLDIQQEFAPGELTVTLNINAPISRALLTTHFQ